MNREFYEDEFPLGFVVIYLVMFALAWIYVSSANSDDDDKILKCAETPGCINPWQS
jgi:hypothetical protein